MKKLILIIPFIAHMSCGESEKEKQERLSKELMGNINTIKAQGQKTVDSLDALIKASKIADSLQSEIDKALAK